MIYFRHYYSDEEWEEILDKVVRKPYSDKDLAAYMEAR